MTKSKTILAGLGVVAALGVAAMPLASYAAPTVIGNVMLAVEVEPAIAMTIKGNNDSYTHGTNPGSTTDGVDNLYDNGSTGGNTGAVDNKTVSTAASTEKTSGESPNTTHVGYEATGTSSSYAHLLPNSAVTGDRGTNNATNDFGSTITVYTNSKSGYTVTLQDADDDASLVSTTDTNDTIPTGTTIAAGTSGWAFKGGKSSSVSNDVYTFTDRSAWTAIPDTTETEVVVYGSNSDTYADETHGDQFIINYGVSTSSDQATGLYTDTIVYTATTK